MAGSNNQRNIFFASFMTLIAAGIGFAIRGAILDDWAAQFGFTKSDLGGITGGGLTGFGITIIICSMFADRVGYKALLALAFLLHLASAAVTLAATPVFLSSGKDATFWCLYVGMFLFALGNGVCEAAINPLVATLFPKQKTHYLNILHAGWPGGLILGALLAFMFAGPKAAVTTLRWEIPMMFFVVPTLIYGLITLKESFPLSEARAAGVTFGKMLGQFASPMLLLLLFLHACVGYVELGTDSWITNIMKNMIPENYSLLLFIYTSGIMFILRFFAGPIVHRINPLGLLFLSGVLGAVGLYTLGSVNSALAIVIAATIYGVGKTFLWPTMLGVVGERFPQGGAMVMGTMGGIGMLSAGLLGGPGIGYKQDYYASGNLKQEAPATYQRYVSDEKNKFLVFPPISGLDGAKVGVLNDKGEDLDKRVAVLEKEGKSLEPNSETAKLVRWWEDAKPHATEDKPPIDTANIFGGQMALKWTAVVPLTMAIGYLLLVLYFVSTGGYKAVHLEEEPVGPAEY